MGAHGVLAAEQPLTDLGLDRSSEPADRPLPDATPPRALGRLRLPLRERAADRLELLDAGCLSLPEVEANLEDLARLNRLPGGTAASIAAIRRLTDGATATRILDVGTGRADMPLAFVAHGWATVATDTNRDVLVVARREAAAAHIEVVEADARRLPFGDGEFDVVHASLLIHHLAADDAVAALREMRRVARNGLVVNDVRRGLWPMTASWVAMTVLARSRVTMADGITSVRAAYTAAELAQLAHAAGLRIAWRSSSWWPRVATALVPG